MSRAIGTYDPVGRLGFGLEDSCLYKDTLALQENVESTTVKTESL
jgi:hypothetical protein